MCYLWKDAPDLTNFNDNDAFRTILMMQSVEPGQESVFALLRNHQTNN